MNTESSNKINNSIIILSWNGRDYISDCIAAISSQTDRSSEIIMIDNASQDESVKLAQAILPDIRIVQNKVNLGVSAGWNAGLSIAQGQSLIFLNQDVIVKGGWLEEIIDTLDRDERIGVVGSKLLFPDGITIQHAGGYLLQPSGQGKHRGLMERDYGQYDEEVEAIYVTGAAFAVKRTLFDQIGQFDELFYPAYYEDVDLCFRARIAGYKVIYQPKAVAIHHESTSLGQQSTAFYNSYHLNRLRFALKHLPIEELDAFEALETNRLSEPNQSNEFNPLKDVYLQKIVCTNEANQERMNLILTNLCRAIEYVL
jgi:GT2 family glycosyltransferase